MKLCTFSQDPSPHVGLVWDETWLVDLQRAAPHLPLSMLEMLQDWDASLEQLRALHTHLLTQPFEQIKPLLLAISEVRLLPPVLAPSKIICAGLNYYDHCREQNVKIPERLILFTKHPSALAGAGTAITWPAGLTEQVDYEAELALVIGRRVRDLTPETALSAVAGYTILNDVSARDLQFAEKQWVRAKSLDSFCPMGPWLVTPDEVGDPNALKIGCRLNGQVMQDSNTSEMIFKVANVLAIASAGATLLPGDVISTGTPDGVGVFRKPPVFLKPGDQIEIEIEKIGTLSNPVAA
ncbi:MAG TPA: fumarylacetoacetate hydrolase family protein [Anaerolineaceae bacterium]|nr:fumarylacetoacetate hydrolase family protein [Anaerolineaceae bacterium]HPN52541.1 fumarylacetoacetate hydrolase family protein [Anaerolineaceae bacterium]